MRFTKGGERRRMIDFEITAMVDVVFLLIIFFMTTARFARETRADLDLPVERGEQQEINEEAGLVINIDRTGAIQVGSTPVDLAGLEQLVREEAARLSQGAQMVKLMIRADRNADTTQLNQVVTLLQKTGVGSARLGTEVPGL